jgi:hypothetical protein
MIGLYLLFGIALTPGHFLGAAVLLFLWFFVRGGNTSIIENQKRGVEYGRRL